MLEIIVAIMLMSFIVWSYNILNKNFIVAAKDASSQDSGLFSIKRLMLIVLLFIGCYCFIAVTTQQAKNDVVDEINQDQLMQAQSGGPASSDLASMLEQPRFQMPEKSKEFRVIPPDQIPTKFKDLAGMAEAKDEVQDIIRFLQNPDDFGRLGAKPPKGILLHGEPGTGKTLLARAIAGEAKVSFIAVAGSEFDEEYVGVGAARVRQLFETARQNAPCIIFIDEIDALAHKRQTQDPSWTAQTVNQLLAEMDGLDSEQNNGVIVIGATNRLKAIDPAVLRPGRLDRHIELSMPTTSERAEIINLYLKKVVVSPKVNANDIAKMTTGFSNAELANLVNEAAILATKANKKQIEPQDFDTAKDRLVLGTAHPSLNISEKNKTITAYHESGHALVGYLLNGIHPTLYKVTIAPRGPSLGHTAYEPNADNTSISQQELEARITAMLAGRVAEEIVFGEENITTGAESDLKHATELAYNMVTRWGFSKQVGLIYNGGDTDIVSSGVIEEEVQAIIERCHARAKELLTNNRAQLNKLAKALIERETLDANEIKKLLNAPPSKAVST